jgi:signal transduction histidine kinase
MEQTTEDKLLKILHLEDNPQDAEIVRTLLKEENLGVTMHRVASREEFEQALEQRNWDIIISDFAMPGYNGMKALSLAREKLPDVAFILFSGTIGEETAVQSLKLGASDYILKQRPARLASAVRNVIEQMAERERRESAELELKKSEQQKKQIEEQFLRVQRMESIGSLVGGVAHDLNNALVPVFMGISILRSEQLSAQSRQILQTMESSVKRGAEMLKQVLTFARGVEGKQTTIKVEMLLREMEKIMKDLFPKFINARVKFASGLWTVSGYATQLHQVLMNLCINARDAMPNGGQITIMAENILLDESEARMHPDAAPGRYLRLSVCDTGSGMNPETVQRIFEPFFTTKAPGKGTGLGLSTSLNIVKNHGGFIAVKSQLGQGTEFHIYLPALTAAPTAELDEKQMNLPTGRGELILVVDDEAAICELTKATLENYGYRVMTAGSGPEAVAVFADKRQEVKLVVTDTAMPFMDGRATSLALRKINPQIKIITASGDGDRKESDTNFRLKVNAFIPKPYTAEKLIATVNDVLTEKTAAHC